SVFSVCSLPIISTRAQVTADYAVQLSASVQTNPAQITLSWVHDPQASVYTVYRKSRDASSWGSGTTLQGASSTYADSNVAVGGAYEYRVDKTAVVGGGGVAGTGYIYAGIQAPMVDSRGKVILLVDSTFAAALAPELATLQ